MATAAEWGAAELGGTSLARITFWLKLEEAVAFCAVILILDRLLRSDPGMRLRAHLLWSVNPLLLWEIVAGGHIDGLAVVFGLLGIAALRARAPQGENDRGESKARPEIGVGGAVLAGLLIGVAADIKVEYVLLRPGCGLGLPQVAQGRQPPRRPVSPWRSSRPTWRPALPAIKVLVTRSPGVTWDTMYQLFWRPVLGVHPVQRVKLPAAPGTDRLPALRGGRAAGPAALAGPGHPGCRPSPRPWP